MLIIGASVAVCVVGGVYAMQSLFAGERATFQSQCGYSDCAWTGDVVVKLNEPFPPPCPKCKRNSVLPLSVCSKCGHRQIANERLRYIPGNEKLPGTTKCDKCGAAIKQGG